LKDFDRLSKHLEYLNNTLNKTKTDFDLSENRVKEQNETNQRLQQSIKNLKESHENQCREMKKQELNLIEKIQLLTTQKIHLEEKLKEINDECTSRGEQLQKLGKFSLFRDDFEKFVL
jgi:chromosome segregation ATPase